MKWGGALRSHDRIGASSAVDWCWQTQGRRAPVPTSELQTAVLEWTLVGTRSPARARGWAKAPRTFLRPGQGTFFSGGARQGRGLLVEPGNPKRRSPGFMAVAGGPSAPRGGLPGEGGGVECRRSGGLKETSVRRAMGAAERRPPAIRESSRAFAQGL